MQFTADDEKTINTISIHFFEWRFGWSGELDADWYIKTRVDSSRVRIQINDLAPYRELSALVEVPGYKIIACRRSKLLIHILITSR